MKSSLVLCPCGRWHGIVTIVTETYRHRFRCGLRVTCKAGNLQFAYKKHQVEIVELASGQEHLFIRVRKVGV